MFLRLFWMCIKNRKKIVKVKKIVNGEKVYRSRFSLGFSHFFLEKAFADELFMCILQRMCMKYLFGMQTDSSHIIARTHAYIEKEL